MRDAVGGEGHISVREDTVEPGDVVGESYSCILDLAASIELNPSFFKLGEETGRANEKVI